MEKKETRGSFSSRLGYVLAVAGSAVGLGNIWRFPYLAAKYGGGTFLFVYIILAVTFGFALLITETAIGRKTGSSAVKAFDKLSKGKFKFGGIISATIPMLILPYYCVIGGWIIKYIYEFLTGNLTKLTNTNYFTGFVSNAGTPLIYLAIFAVITYLVVILGVEKGVEKSSRIMMPLLIIMAVFVSIYSMTVPGALAGIKYYLLPNFSNFSIMTVVAAMGQMFYSLSIAMGILITYGSYMKKEDDMEKSISQVEILDTLVAFLAGLMIIPAVFAFSNGDENALKAGASLMFITMPKVFASMNFGLFIGLLFFILVAFAALTSAISLFETNVSTFCDTLGWSRKKASIVVLLIVFLLGIPSSLGYGFLSWLTPLGMSVLDFFDFLTNSLMMPIAAISTVILLWFYCGTQTIVDEVEQSSKFKRKKAYLFSIKYLVIPGLVIIFISSLLSAFNIIHF